MSGQKFSLVIGESVDSSTITGNGRQTVFNSSIVSNTQGSDGYIYDSLRLVVDYEDFQGSSRNGIQAIVESSNGESGDSLRWFPVAYQYNPYFEVGNGDKREIVLQPNLLVMDAGIDDIVWDGGFAAAISRQQGKLGSDFRVIMRVNERAYGEANAFSSAKFSIYGEMFNAYA